LIEAFNLLENWVIIPLSLIVGTSGMLRNLRKLTTVLLKALRSVLRNKRVFYVSLFQFLLSRSYAS